MTKKGLLATGAIVFFVLTGCLNDPGLDVISRSRDSSPSEDPAPPDSPFKEVSYLAQLISALQDDTADEIRIADNITLSGVPEIPKRKTLEIMGQKTLTINEEITVNGIISIMDDANMRIESPVAFSPSSHFDIAPGGRVVAGSDVTAMGTVVVRGHISLGNKAQLIVEQNLDVDGDITVGNGAELIVTPGVSGAVNGTITVLNGGLFRDQSAEGTWVHNREGSGSIILKYGSTTYIGSGTKPAIGPLTDAGLFRLTGTTSALTLMNKGYLLEGGAVLNGDFTLKTKEVFWIRNGTLNVGPEKDFIIKDGANFIIEDEAKLTIEDKAKLNIENGARLTIEDRAVLELVDSTNGRLNGTVEVRRGGRFIKGSGSLFAEGGGGGLVIHAGALVQQTPDSETIIGTNGTKVRLESGRIEVKNGRKYRLDGSAKLIGKVSVKKLALTPVSVLIVDAGAELETPSGLSSISGESDGEAASTIVLVSNLSLITDTSSETNKITGPKILTLQNVEQWL
jgi:hypothetical protein